MPTLLLMRHAKSSWADASLEDHDRPLNKRGRRDAPRMGRWLVEQKLPPRRIVTSSALRARETAELLAEAIAFTGPLDVRTELYHASVPVLESLLPELVGSDGGVLVIGHNPGLVDFLEHAVGKSPRMPTAAIALLDCNFSNNADASRIQLRDVWRPRELP